AVPLHLSRLLQCSRNHRGFNLEVSWYRRPKPPPESVVCPVMDLGEMPSAFATAPRIHSGDCVGAQISAPSSRTKTVQFIGSIVACAWNGASYTASIFFAALEIPSSSLPSLRPLFCA